MAGKMCMGTNDVPKDPRLARAYCEGRQGLYDAWPGAGSNPHPDGTPEYEAWSRGFFSVENPDGVPLPIDCCATRARGPII